MLHRKERLSKLLRAEMNQAIMRELEFPGALVTVTSVTLGEKMEVGKIKVSVLPDTAAKKVIEELGMKARSLRRIIAKRVPMRLMPQLIFELDRGFENAAAVEKALLEAGPIPEGEGEE